MTSDQIKSTYTMRDVVERYGIKVKRDGMCCCPFHGEKHPSMKVYKDSYNCFACGANGDIFTFVQNMDNCDFKTAFYQLGGTYSKPTISSKMALYHAQKAKEKRNFEEHKKKQRIKELHEKLRFYRYMCSISTPGTDEHWNWLDKFYMTLVWIENMEGGSNN